MEFQQKPDADSGAQTHPVASDDQQINDFSTSRLRKCIRSGDPQPTIRNVLGVLDSLMTKCHYKGDYKAFAAHLSAHDATATRATLELIRRQTRNFEEVLRNAEAGLLEVQATQARPLGELPEGDDE